MELNVRIIYFKLKKTKLKNPAGRLHVLTSVVEELTSEPPRTTPVSGKCGTWNL